MPVTMAGRPEVVKNGVVEWVLALACLLLWAIKFWLVPRLNINWDEFYFLSHVHALVRGELGQGLQTAYTRLFAWLPGVPGDEITQILVARTLMVALLGVSALLIQRLATRWFPPAAAWTAAIAFLAMYPTLKHGGSFRADSLLLPLQLGALVLLTHPARSDRDRGLGAGVLLGLATVISVKAVLLTPLVAALGIGEPRDWRRGLRRLAWLAGGALVTATALLGLHLLFLPGQSVMDATAATAGRAWRKTLGETPWLPQIWTLREMLGEDLVAWLLAAGGLVWALWRRLWSVAAGALALLPVLFYRNSFAYYYVVMWGPACLVMAAAAAGAHELTSRAARPSIATAAALALAALLLGQGLRDLPLLAHPRQDAQRQLVAAVHGIFPEPVPYVDHSGMMASFRKVNFFMSSWGMESYVARARPFMPGAMARHRPPLLIANRAELMQGTGNYRMLLDEDRELIETYYQPYWGPIRIAGAAAVLHGLKPVAMQLPFGGGYRLESLHPVRIDGRLIRPGESIAVSDEQLVVQVAVDDARVATDSPLAVRLLWAGAKPAPVVLPLSLNYYDGL